MTPARDSLVLLLRLDFSGLASASMAAIKKTNKYQVWERMWRKGSPRALLVGLQIGAAAVGNSVEAPQEIKSSRIQLSHHF